MLGDVGVLQEKLKNVVSQIDILQKEKKIIEEEIVKAKDRCYKKMISIVNRWLTKDKNTANALVFSTALANRGRILTSEVKKFIKFEGNIFHLTNDKHRDYNLIFHQEGEYHYIKKEVMKYLAMTKPVKAKSPVVSTKAKSPVVSTKSKSPVKSKVSDKAVSPRTAMLNKTPFMRAKAKALLKQKQAQ
jgi:hypothetical protein